MIKPERKNGISENRLQLIKDINDQLVENLKIQRVCFTITNDITDQSVVANALLKLGLKRKAIPWKIKEIDEQDPEHIFIGIDLGHNHTKRNSNLTIVAIDNQGCLINNYRKL